VIYVENSDNVTTLNGEYAGRQDIIGHFWLRRSLDGGQTWGSTTERWEIPVRETKIDRENSWNGKTRIMWAVDKGFVSPSHGAFLAFAKVGTYVVDAPTSAWLLNSPNLATADDPADIEWRLFPEGEDGIHNWQSLAPGISEEGHVVPMKNGSLYYVFRTDVGVLGARVSDDGGKTFHDPDPEQRGAAQYAPAGTKVIKNPRGPITPRAVGALGGSTEYLLLFYNNGGAGFDNRNPYWIVPGWEMNGTILWGQPEVGLYSVDVADRIGYSDFIVDTGEKAVYISETEKVHCRMHRVGEELLHGLLHQRDYHSNAVEGLAAAPIGPVDVGSSTKALVNSSLDGGFAITMQLTGPLKEGKSIMLSTLETTPSTTDGGIIQTGIRLAKGIVQEAITLDVGHLGGHDGHLNIPFRFFLDAECAAVLSSPAGGGGHFFAVSVDARSRVITAMVDGGLCDGGKHKAQGWVVMPRGVDDPMIHVNGADSVTVGPATAGITGVRLYSRYLRTTEMLGNYRASN
jgi:hypothetical protein